MTTNITKEEWLATLVGLDTTSRNSNMGLIETIRDALSAQGVSSWLTTDDKGAKANLFATLPASDGQTQGGVALSGHTDVVPVDGQDWNSDPFVLLPSHDRFYGRGTCDMKGFIATVDAHRVRAADAMCTGAAERQRAVDLPFDLVQRVEHSVRGEQFHVVVHPVRLRILLRVKATHDERDQK